MSQKRETKLPGSLTAVRHLNHPKHPFSSVPEAKAEMDGGLEVAGERPSNQ